MQKQYKCTSSSSCGCYDGYYDKWPEGYEELHKEEQLKKAKIIRDNLEIKKAAKLLDVGCGTGIYLGLFGCKVMGVDPSKGLLERNKFPHKQAFAENLPFKDGSFDIVISITAIHLFRDIEKSLTEIKRVGKKQFALSVLKSTKKLGKIARIVKKHFVIKKIILEEKDVIYFLEKRET